jgi:hypothetical protein
MVKKKMSALGEDIVDFSALVDKILSATGI